MDQNRDPLGMGESNRPAYWNRDPNDELPNAQVGRGGGYIKTLRVLAYLIAAGFAIFGIVTAAISQHAGSAGAGFLTFLLSLLYALVVLVVIMVYVEMAANVKAIADNTASMKAQLDSLKRQLKESRPE